MTLIQTITPLAGNATYTSSTQQISRADKVTGSVFADQSGTLYVDQSGDGTNWDFTQTYAVSANNGVSFELDLLNPYFRIRYTNGTSAQTLFRLFANARDPYGSFLAPSTPPTAGGAWAVLAYITNTLTYTYVGRFDAIDAWGACSAAAVYLQANGKYAAFPVTAATVSDEVIIQTSTHNPDAF